MLLMNNYLKNLRQIDKLIAEEIFGWSDFWESPKNFYYLMGYPPEEQAMGLDAERQEVWNYSTDISAAWSIVDNFYSAFIEKLSDKPKYSAYLVSKDGPFSTDGSAEAQTVAIAICLAALRAKRKNMQIGAPIKICSDVNELDAIISGEREDGKGIFLWLVSCPEKDIFDAPFCKDPLDGKYYNFGNLGGTEFWIVPAVDPVKELFDGLVLTEVEQGLSGT